MEQKIYGTSAPFMKGSMTSAKMMGYFILALIPAGLHGIWRYGINAVLAILLTCVSAVATEYAWEKGMKQPIRIKDGRMLLTGLIMSYCLPPYISWYVAIIAGILCALIVQVNLHLFSKNIVSPVILARLVLMLVFQKEMFNFVYDGVTMATPLAALKHEGMVNTLFMIFGNTGGCIGEGSALLLCLGAIFLILLGLIDFRVTGMYLFSFAAFMAVFGGHGLSSYYLTAQLAGGGFMLALWFIAPAYSTIPITKSGRWIYGILLGVLTGFFRIFGPGAENICYAILIANLCVPVIEKFTIPRPFGVEKGHL